jgi:hypothetical protein
MTASDGNLVPGPADAEATAKTETATERALGLTRRSNDVAATRIGGPADLISHNQPAPLDAPARALIAALRAAPEGDVLWTKEGDARWIARRAHMDVLLRAGDLLRIPNVDYYSKIALAEEVTWAARGPAIAATEDSTVDSPAIRAGKAPAVAGGAPGRGETAAAVRTGGPDFPAAPSARQGTSPRHRAASTGIAPSARQARPGRPR